MDQQTCYACKTNKSNSFTYTFCDNRTEENVLPLRPNRIRGDGVALAILNTILLQFFLNFSIFFVILMDFLLFWSAKYEKEKKVLKINHLKCINNL